MWSDYQCKSCQHVQEYKKEYKGVFPPEITCEKCGGVSARIYSKPLVSIGEGFDSQTGQTFVSPFSPKPKTFNDFFDGES